MRDLTRTLCKNFAFPTFSMTDLEPKCGNKTRIGKESTKGEGGEKSVAGDERRLKGSVGTNAWPGGAGLACSRCKEFCDDEGERSRNGNISPFHVLLDSAGGRQSSSRHGPGRSRLPPKASVGVNWLGLQAFPPLLRGAERGRGGSRGGG